MLEMLTVPGLRPEKVLRLYKDLGITSLAELEAAARDDRIKKAKGLGGALQTKVLQNLTIAKSGAARLHMHRAAVLLEHAVESLRDARSEFNPRPLLAISGVAANLSAISPSWPRISAPALVPALRDSSGSRYIWRTESISVLPCSRRLDLPHTSTSSGRWRSGRA